MRKQEDAVPVTARKWLIGADNSVLVTSFVLAEGTHHDLIRQDIFSAGWI